MSEEIFDVVDAQDVVIGQAERSQVHRRGMRHRAVHVMIRNSRGEVFLQKRSAFKDTFPGRWDSSASGHLSAGEDYDACAEREVEEELGIECPRPLQKLFRVEACEETGQEFVWVYAGSSDGPFQCPPEEIECGGWFSPERIESWMAEVPDAFSPAVALIWPGVKKYFIAQGAHES